MYIGKVNNIVNKFAQLHGLKAKYNVVGPQDGYLKIGKERYVVFCRGELRKYQIPDLIEQKEFHKKIIVVAENLFPAVKGELVAHGINYLEENGNAYMKANGLYVFVDVNRGPVKKTIKGNRAFTKTGLKVLFHLLRNKNLINETQREIAKVTGVALGTIPQVIEGLKETGYLIPLNNKEYLWENKLELFNRWVEGYNTDLRPKLVKGNYTIKGDWREIRFDRNKNQWGGELGADLLTNYLRPEKYELYTKEDQKALIKNYRIMPKEDGELTVLEMFWEAKGNDKVVPPLVVYADLMHEGGKRNEETAEIIFNEHIEKNL